MSERRVLIGLIGANIMGSLSPALFADAFAAAGIDGFYHLIDVDRSRERRLPQLLAAIKTAGFAGTNITFPVQARGHAAARRRGPRGGADRRGQYRGDCAGRPHHRL